MASSCSASIWRQTQVSTHHTHSAATHSQAGHAVAATGQRGGVTDVQHCRPHTTLHNHLQPHRPAWNRIGVVADVSRVPACSSVSSLPLLLSSAFRFENFAQVAPAVVLSKLPESNPWLLSQRLVAKPDQLIKRRGKAGLIKLNATWDEAQQWIEERRNKEVQVSENEQHKHSQPRTRLLVRSISDGHARLESVCAVPQMPASSDVSNPSAVVCLSPQLSCVRLRS